MRAFYSMALLATGLWIAVAATSAAQPATGQAGTTQPQTTQGQATQGQTTQGQATQGQATQGQATQGQATQERTTQEGQTMQGQATQGQTWTSQGQTTQGQATSPATTEQRRAGAGVATAQGQARTPVKSRDLIGVTVYNRQDENLGKIEELVMDPSSGQIRYAVLSMGGFLGMGNKLFAVPWNELKLVSKGTTSAGTVKEDHYVLDVTKEGLQNAPGFDKNNWPDFANREWTSKIDQFYMGRRPAAGSQTR